ncbi:MAG: energy-coupling factor transporter transmembrane protein EcfT [Ruminococcaceae bacterium]|nr:energy-coupling factor transporter transmembrane protein EcfT [Oscillospiraceae bacterium]
MLKQGILITSEFAEYHPIVNLCYFLLAVGITMFTLNPIFLSVSVVCAYIYSVLLGGMPALKFNIATMFVVGIIMTFINGFFSHNGATVLFYLNDNRITKEAFIYGLVSSIMLTTVIVWFSCFNRIMNSEKLVYIFGKFAPVIGLTLSMIFRFVPLLKTRYAEIHQGQQSMVGNQKMSIRDKISLRLKEVSILISWSLESSIETADSMAARGYGLRGRTSFTIFKFSRRDSVLLVLMVIFGGITIFGFSQGVGQMYFYPLIDVGKVTPLLMVSVVSYFLLLLLPILLDVWGTRKWK